MRNVVADCQSGERNGSLITGLLDVLVGDPPDDTRTAAESTLASLIADYVHTRAGDRPLAAHLQIALPMMPAGTAV